MPARVLILFFAICIFSPFAAAADDIRHVRIELAAENGNITSGQAVRLGIRQTIAPGWHTYWINPGDAGQAMRVKWTLPPGFTVSDLRWPAPERIDASGVMSFGYEHGALPVATLTAPATLPAGPVTVGAATETLVCRDICIPQFDHLSFTFNAGAAGDAAVAATALPARVRGRMESATSFSVALGGGTIWGRHSIRRDRSRCYLMTGAASMRKRPSRRKRPRTA